MSRKRRPFEYRIVVRYSEEDEGYIAIVPELRGCSAWGETEQKALEAVEDAARVWLESARANGIEIPVPLDKQAVSGKYHLRMPPDLYRELAFEAKAQGLSLNQYIVHKLSRVVG